MLRSLAKRLRKKLKHFRRSVEKTRDSSRRGLIRRLILVYHRIRNVPIVWNFLNRRAVAAFRRAPPELSTLERALVQKLRTDGIAIVQVNELLPADVFQDLRRYALERWQDPEVRQRHSERGAAYDGEKLKTKDFFLVNLWDGEHVLDLGNPFLKFSLSEPILKVVNSYMGMWSKFRAWHLQATVPMPADIGPISSQQWHRDPEDRKLVKMFLYMNDVEVDQGPFRYLRSSHSLGVWSRLYPQAHPAGSRASADAIPAEDVVICTGPAGTLIFCDTSGFHCGGFARNGLRFMYTSVYSSSASAWPVRYTYPALPAPDSLSDPARFALDNDPDQRPPRYEK